MMPMNKTQTILIVDDTPSNLAVVVNLFEGRGYRVSIARDGEEGLQRAQLLQPDIILLDVMMPGVDGFETCRRLKAGADTRGIPVIFMTSLASSEHKLLGFQAGAVDYVTKPLQFDEVIARVDTHLKLHAAQKKLAEQNEELERRVAERTIELNMSNLQLRAEIEGRICAQEKLATREREFRTLAENLPDNIIRYDLQARKTFVNSAVVRTLGTDSSLLIGKVPEESSLERIAEISEYEKILRQVLECGEPDEFEMAVPHASDGAQIHNIRFVAERDAQGKITGALAIGRDTTAQKIAEAALREREQRYHEIFDNAVEGMYLLEVTEDGRFRNLDINPALAASTGMPRETMIGKFVDDTVPEDIGRLIVEKYRRCVAAGKTIQESIELDLPSGKHYYYSTITPIYYDGRIHRLIGISRDITELKRVEHELEKSREQLRGLTARREKVREDERKYIAREVHDELGQILTGLQMDVSMLAYKFGNNIPALHEHLQGTLALVNKSLAVARNVAASLRPGSLDMGIVSAIEWLVERYSKNTGIECEVHVCDGDRNIELNESASIALFRIAQESLTNVARHAQANKVDIAISQEGDEYLLEIRDNGKGFDAAATKAGSFGLLGIRERVYMLSGEMAIVSTPGSGTAISVRIPANNDSTGNNLSPGAT